MAEIFSITISALSCAYFCAIVLLVLGTIRLSSSAQKMQPPSLVSIIIPARDEETTIKRCVTSLLDQDYQGEFEIIVVNDGSTDNTPQIVAKLISRDPRVSLIKMPTMEHSDSPKKAAISKAVEQARGTIILTTDADCVAGKGWLSGIIRAFQNDTHMVAGWVCSHSSDEVRFFHKVQALEFLALVGTGAGAFGLGKPLISNAANLAFRRSTFVEAGGFSAIDHYVSGDDVLLMHKFRKISSNAVRFSADTDTIIYTSPQPTLNAFLQQRRRWISKVLAIPSWRTKGTLVLAYLYYVLLLAGLALLPVHNSFLMPVAFSYSLKIFGDFLFLNQVCRIVKRKDLLRYFILAEFFQIVYVVVVGPASITRRFTWKGRAYNKSGLVKK